MKVFVTGASGFIGKSICNRLIERGDEVVALTRDSSRLADGWAKKVRVVQGDPSVQGNWQEAVDGTDAIIHLAGENISSKRWNSRFKKLIHSSRIDSTRNLVSTILACNQKPKQLIAASAIGWYGDTGNTLIDESALSAGDFLGGLCRDWEDASKPLMGTTVLRTVIRFGLVLDSSGGVLPQLMLPIRWNVGGPISDGKFFMSWVHLKDLNNLIFWVLDKKIGGIFNGVAPNPVINLEFVRTIAARLNKLAILPVPYCVFRLITGEIAQAICASQRIYPKAIIDSGFQFDFPTLELALNDLLP